MLQANHQVIRAPTTIHDGRGPLVVAGNGVPAPREPRAVFRIAAAAANVDITALNNEMRSVHSVNKTFMDANIGKFGFERLDSTLQDHLWGTKERALREGKHDNSKYGEFAREVSHGGSLMAGRDHPVKIKSGLACYLRFDL